MKKLLTSFSTAEKARKRFYPQSESLEYDSDQLKPSKLIQSTHIIFELIAPASSDRRAFRRSLIANNHLKIIGFPLKNQYLS